ncbi:unnamed protein product [Durusdinium trenchii]|uniref:Gamma-butyrobetaine hydroxylase-like N-terminal domain-containing protein n=2 Tax=Durusdinium trenchii TaxID=1381693 RepID=A0ABP0K535_9DINO
MMFHSLCTLLAVKSSAFPAVELATKSSLKLSLPAGQKFDLDPFWLRERCLSPAYVDVNTKQPLWMPHEMPKDIFFQNASIIGGDTLQVGFTDGHTSHFDLEHLSKELTDFRHTVIQPAAYARPEPILWSEGNATEAGQ